jgi:hypothetical protein
LLNFATVIDRRYSYIGKDALARAAKTLSATEI